MAIKLDANTGKWIDDGKTSEQSAANTPSSIDLTNLDHMSREELIALVRGLPSAPIAHALLTKEEKRERLKAKIYNLAMDSENEKVVIKSANDWLDREDGKAMQQIKQEVNLNGAIALVSKEEVTGIIDNWLGKVIEHAPS